MYTSFAVLRKETLFRLGLCTKDAIERMIKKPQKEIISGPCVKRERGR